MSRVPTKVLKTKFRSAVRQAEKPGALASMSALYGAVCTIYNEMDVPVTITPTIVRDRLEDWEVDTKTVKGHNGGRTKTDIDVKVLRKAVKQVESSGEVEERSDLWPLVARAYNAMDVPAQITKGMAKSNVKELGIKLRTPKGKPGRKKVEETTVFVDSDLHKLIDRLVEEKVTFQVAPFENGVNVTAKVDESVLAV